MPLKYYSTTKPTSLSSGMTANDTAVYLVDGSSFPDPFVPGNDEYTVIIGYGSDREEICTVTAKPGANQLTVLRGQDGTAAIAKNIGDVVVHGVSARDFEGVVKVGGSTMTGPLVLSGAPTIDLHAATKKYVDDAAAATAVAYAAAIANAVPAGLIAPFGSSTAMPGWLLANGQSTTGYPALIAMYGATVPDLRDKFVLGNGGSLPDTGGASAVSLSTANMPSHSHGGATGNMSANSVHGHTLSGGAVFMAHTSGNTASGADWAAANSLQAGTTNADLQHTHSITPEGSGTAHENMPPYYALTFQVRAG